MKILSGCAKDLLIVDLAEDQLQQLASNGVKDIIATFGAIDISNLYTAQDKSPEQLAESVADSVLQFVTIAKKLNISVLYVTPCFTELMPERQYGQFMTTLLEILQQTGITYCNMGEVMEATTEQGKYLETADICTSNGLHLTHEFGRYLLQTMLNMVGITEMPEPANLSPQYTVVQRKQRTGCYVCGSSSHN